ncbi:MAG: NAD-dependent epimerase/dehydratase family protein [Gracilimonas sp.]
MSKIYLTGSAGFIGSRLWSKLFDLGIETENCDFKINRDILSYDPGEVNVIYHLGAQAGAMPSWKDPMYDARNNILATIKVCEIAKKNNAKIIFTTSGSAVEPESPYGISKQVCEKYLKLLHPNSVILRLSSIYGEKDRGVVDTFIRDDKCTIYGDGSATRDFVHVDDIVEALIKAKDWEPGEYTLGSGKGTTVRELAEATGKPIEYQEARKGEKQEVVLENTAPDWVPIISALDYIKAKCR